MMPPQALAEAIEVRDELQLRFIVSSGGGDAQPTARDLSQRERRQMVPLSRRGWKCFRLTQSQPASGGATTKIELGDFLGKGKAGPEHQALFGLIGTLVDEH
jgi:hypothetical protein